MASRLTKDTPPGKEKRGATPASNVATTRTVTTSSRERSLNSSKKAASLPRTHNPSPKKPASSTLAPKPSPLQTSKSIPTHLNPKLSTTVWDDSKQQGKKPVSKASSATLKPTLLKGKSFGAPSLTSQSQKTLVSPSPTLRSSSSFSGKATGPQKGLPNRNLSAPKEAGKRHTLHARLENATKKNGMIYVKKHQTGDSSLNAKGKIAVHPQKLHDVTSVPNVIEPGTQSKEQIAVQNGDSIGKGNENLLSENQPPITYEQTAKIVNREPRAISEPMNDERTVENKDGTSATFEPLSTILEHEETLEPLSTILEHQEPVKIDQAARKGENKTVLAISSEGIKDSLAGHPQLIDFIKQTEGGNKNTDTKIVSESGVEPLEVPKTQGTSAGTKTEVPEELKKEDAVNEMNNLINSDEVIGGNISNEVEAKKRDEGEEAMGWSKKAEPEKDAQPVVVESKKAVAPNVHTAHGKKDIAVSNDKIEETASKLREQRRNKVRALAGAFESVISLQETDSPKKKDYH